MSTSADFSTARNFASNHGRIDPEIMLEIHTDPGVRGLIDNAVEREIVMAPGQRLRIEQVFDDVPSGANTRYKRYIVARLLQ